MSPLDVFSTYGLTFLRNNSQIFDFFEIGLRRSFSITMRLQNVKMAPKMRNFQAEISRTGPSAIVSSDNRRHLFSRALSEPRTNGHFVGRES